MIHKNESQSVSEMNNFFTPLLHVYQNIDLRPHAVNVIGDMPFYHFLLFLTMRLDLKTLDSLLFMKKKATRMYGEFDIYQELANSLLDPNSLYVSKVITLMIDRFDSNICFMGRWMD